jgi:glycosyltransferase involved in cell wall biosynthesis
MSDDQMELPSQQGRPLVTFALFAYNQEKFIREAVEGAFAQTYEPLEIILSDDCSTDQTFEIMQEIAANYVGLRIIILNRNSRNLGVAAHFSEIVERASGEFVVIAAGDDISLPMRTEISVLPMVEDSAISFTETRLIDFTDDERPNEFIAIPRGIIKTPSILFSLDDYLMKMSPSLIGAGRTVRRHLLTDFSSLSSQCPTEDTPSVLRLLMRGKGLVTSETAVLRRIHNGNLSSPQSLFKMNLLAIEEQYLRDIRVARANGWVTESKSRALAEWVKSTMLKRAIFIRLNAGFRPHFKQIAEAVFSSQFSIREKIYIARTSLARIVL